jgi:hypothetical protein
VQDSFLGKVKNKGAASVAQKEQSGDLNRDSD